jgi:hypothetical protein
MEYAMMEAVVGERQKSTRKDVSTIDGKLYMYN